MAFPVGLFDVFVRLGEVFEVYVDIRHGDAVRVEETLEQELVSDRIQVRDFQAVSDDGTGGGASARPHHAPHCARRGDVVLDDQEVVREAHPADGLELEVDALLLFGGQRLAVPLVRARVGEVAQVGDRVAESVTPVVALLVTAARVDDVLVPLHLGVDVLHERRVDLVDRKHRVAVDAVRLHLVHDLLGVGDGFRMLREQGEHLFLALEVLLLRIAQPSRVVDEGVGIQTDEPVVNGAVLLPDEVDVVRRDDLHPILFRQVEEYFRVFFLAFVDFLRLPRHLGLVEHHFQVVVVSEQALVPLDRLAGRLQVACEDLLRDLARHARRRADEPLVVLFQHLVPNARLPVVHALDVPGRDNLDEVFVALVVLRQQDQVVVGAVRLVLQFVVVPPRHVDLAADDGFHRRMLFRELEELLDAVQVAVVRDRQGGLPQLFRAGE